MKYFNFKNARVLFLLFSLIVIGFSFIATKNSHAQNGSNLSGSCGLLLNRNFGGMEAHYLGDQTVAQNFIGIIDFDNLKASISYNHVSNFGTANAVGGVSQILNQSIQIGAGPFAGSFAINDATGAPWLILVRVNGANTFLVSEVSTQASSTGICQKTSTPVVTPVA